MPVSSSVEWQTTKSPELLLASITTKVLLEKRIAFAVCATRHIWNMSERLTDTLLPIMREIQLTNYSLNAMANANHELNYALVNLAENIIELKGRRASILDSGDWFESWEISNYIKAIQKDLVAIEICRDSLAIEPSLQAITDYTCDTITRLGRYFLISTLEPPPPQLRRTLPWELPWEIFMHLRDGHGNPSIYDKMMNACAIIFCDTLRDIFINPYTQLTSIDTFVNTTILQLAISMRNNGDFTQMPLLGELIEESGCADTDILLHCLEKHHVHDCWLLDSIISVGSDSAI